MQNFRGIRTMKLDFSPRLNVFSGINGSGKSTILQALSLILSQFSARLADTKHPQITDEMIHNAENFTLLAVQCDEDDANWTIVRNRTGKISTHKSVLENLHRTVRRWKTLYTETPEQTNFPLIAYYPTSRTWLDIPKRIRQQHEFIPLQAYDRNAELGVDFRLFFEWFRLHQDMETRYQNELYKKGKRQEAAAAVDRNLEAVRSAMVSFFPGFSNFCVEYAPLRMELSKDNETLSFQQLSDGEKAFLSLVADIAFRLCLANPHMENPLCGEGIILIDEVELHLHPEWQKDVIPKLLQTFPRCQFVLSTHSSLVLNRVKEGKVFSLIRRDGELECETSNDVYGYLPETVMTSTMGLDGNDLRPKDVNDKLDKLFGHIDNNKFAQAEDLLNEMHTLIPGDAELFRARMLIKRKKLLQK